MRERPLYHSFAWAYDLVVARPGGPPAAAVADVLREHGIGAGAAVLDAGCGSGRYGSELASCGLSVTGVDRSPELIAVAASRAARGLGFAVADLRDWHPAEAFEAAICRGVLNDVVADADRRAVVAGLFGAIRPGGVLVADVRAWAPTVERYTARPEFERRIDTDRGLLEFSSRTELDADRTLRVHERIALGGRAEEFDFTMRCWTAEELVAILKDVGFSRVELGRPAPARADRIVALAERRPG